MNCCYCNTPLDDNARFCTNCGSPVEEQYLQPEYSQPNYSNNAHVSPEAEEAASSVLVWGILGLVFALTGILSILGIVFSAIGLSKAKACAASGPLPSKARVGKSLSIAGLVVGIVATVIKLLYISFCIVLAVSDVAYLS